VPAARIPIVSMITPHSDTAGMDGPRRPGSLIVKVNISAFVHTVSASVLASTPSRFRLS